MTDQVNSGVWLIVVAVLVIVRLCYSEKVWRERFCKPSQIFAASYFLRKSTLSRRFRRQKVGKSVGSGYNGVKPFGAESGHASLPLMKARGHATHSLVSAADISCQSKELCSRYCL